MKKILSLLLVFAMIFCFAACGNTDDEPAAEADANVEQTSEPDENGMTVATEFEFTADPDNEQVIDNLIFNEDVYVKGNNGKIIFNKCEFNGKLVNASEEGTNVFISEWCTFGDGFEAIIENGVGDTNSDYAIPKFMLLQPIDVQINGAGAVTSIGAFDLTVNGKTYTKDDAQFYMDETNGGPMVPYDGTQEGNLLYVGSWTENGEPVELVLFDNAPI